MDKIIDNQEKIELSGDEVKRIVGRNIDVISYHTLGSYNNINELLGKNKECIILYETSYNVGHYVALFINSNNNLEFFDPYGFFPDEELNFAKYDNKPYLSNLIKSSNYSVLYNKKRLQKWKEGTNTCGRWSSLRLRFKNVKLTSFQYLFTNNKCYDGDFWVSAITLLLTN